MAWRSGAGADARVRFTVISVKNELSVTADSSGISSIDSPFAPQLLYRPSGFAMDEPSGGWFLASLDPAANGLHEFQLARVRDGDLDNPDQSTPTATGFSLLYPSSTDSSSDVGLASIYPSASGESELETNPVWCR